MGNAPGRLPANGGKGFFDSVKAALAADLVMGNLEEPLTDDTGTGKCGAELDPAATSSGRRRRTPRTCATPASSCSTWPTTTATTTAPPGYSNTQKALEKYGLEHTGAPDQITVVDVKGVKVAVVGFSSYAVDQQPDRHRRRRKRWSPKAATQADLVVVQVHMGARGLRQDPGQAGHRDVPRREPGRPDQVLARDDRRRRRPDRRARPARDARRWSSTRAG